MSPTDPTQRPWPNVCVFGAGAVGCYFGAKLVQAGAPVTLVARGPHVQAIQANGLIFESGGQQVAVPIAASTEPDAVREADLVLFCVKSRDTDTGARTLAGLLRPGAVVVSLQNGVDNVARMRAAAQLDALAAVVYVACSMAGPGHVRHAGRGDLVLGAVRGGEALGAEAIGGAARGKAERGAPTHLGTIGSDTTQDPVAAVAAVFERAGVPCPVSADVRVDLWVKLVMNCVFNPISALGRSHYARLVADAPTQAVMRDVITECVAVARADQVPLGDAATLLDAALKLGAAMAQATSSTAQDLAAGRPTEIDSLNGYVVRRGEALGVPAPVNRALHALVKLAEPR